MISSQLKIQSLAGITEAKITASHRPFKLISDRTEPTIRIYCAAATRDACGYKIFLEIHRKWVGSENHFTTHISAVSTSSLWDDDRVGLKYSSNYWRPLMSTGVEFACWYPYELKPFPVPRTAPRTVAVLTQAISQRSLCWIISTGMQRIPCRERGLGVQVIY